MQVTLPGLIGLSCLLSFVGAFIKQIRKTLINSIKIKAVKALLVWVLLMLQACVSFPGNKINPDEIERIGTRISPPIYVTMVDLSPEPPSFSLGYQSSGMGSVVELGEQIDRRLIDAGFTLVQKPDAQSHCYATVAYSYKPAGVLFNLLDFLAMLTLYIIPSYEPFDYIVNFEIVDSRNDKLLKAVSLEESADRAMSIFAGSVGPESKYWWTNADHQAMRKLPRAAVSKLVAESRKLGCTK